MKRERDTQTIEAEMRKEQKSLKKAQDRIRSLNAELTTAKKREKARRYTEIGSAIEDVLGVGELSKHDLKVLVDYFQMPVHFNNGTQTTRAAQVSEAIKAKRAKVSAAESSAPNGATSADSKLEAVPSGRQGFTGTGNGSSLPFPPPAKP
ncbi:hypothetical protein [Acidaminococcus fermentans]|uniref:hypothetical protein n=1 Tax=Acidaminococcus fermentans TaxID=905 RepID=UPI003A8EEC54